MADHEMTTLATLRSRLLELDRLATQGEWLSSHRETSNGMFSTQVYDADGEDIATLAWYPVKHVDGSLTTARADNADLIRLLCSQSTRRALLAALEICEDIAWAKDKIEQALADIPEVLHGGPT